jgi:hypothetical protein
MNLTFSPETLLAALTIGSSFGYFFRAWTSARTPRPRYRRATR